MKRDAKALVRIGRALWGPSWQTPMSEALGVSDRTVRYWADGRDVPAGVWDDLADLCRARAGELTDLADLMDKASVRKL